MPTDCNRNCIPIFICKAAFEPVMPDFVGRFTYRFIGYITFLKKTAIAFWDILKTNTDKRNKISKKVNEAG